MNSNSFVYVDIPLSISNNDFTEYHYGTASKTAGQILFEIGALVDSEKYSSYNDMIENYGVYENGELVSKYSYIRVDTTKTLKAPIVRVNITDSSDSSYKETHYYVIDSLSSLCFIPTGDDSGLRCFCSSEKYVDNGDYNPGFWINYDGSISMYEVGPVE